MQLQMGRVVDLAFAIIFAFGAMLYAAHPSTSKSDGVQAKRNIQLLSGKATVPKGGCSGGSSI
jgi:hypothetical protein